MALDDTSNSQFETLNDRAVRLTKLSLPPQSQMSHKIKMTLRVSAKNENWQKLQYRSWCIGMLLCLEFWVSALLPDETIGQLHSV